MRVEHPGASYQVMDRGRPDPSMCQQELLRASEVIGVDKVNPVGPHLGPEDGLVGRAPESHEPALLMGLGYDGFELALVRLGHRAGAAPFEALRSSEHRLLTG